MIKNIMKILTKGKHLKTGEKKWDNGGVIK